MTHIGQFNISSFGCDAGESVDCDSQFVSAPWWRSGEGAEEGVFEEDEGREM